MMHENDRRVHSRARRLGRLLGLLVLAAVGPACYSSSGKTYTAPMAPSGAGVLFSDNFVTAPFTSDADWTESPAASNATLSSTYVPPNYFLSMADTARPGSASALSATTFSSEALTFSVGIKFSASTSNDLAMIQIVDATTPSTVYASATLNAQTGNLALQVGSNAATNVTLSANTLYSVTFTIDGSLNATWHASSTTTTAQAFGSHSTKLQLAASWTSTAGTASTIDFGTVTVSNP